MVVGGILPLHALKDHISPMELLAKRIPRAIFEETYNIVLPSRTQKGEERVYVTWQVDLSSFRQRPRHRHPICLRHVAGEHGEGMVGKVVRACEREGIGEYPGRGSSSV